MWWSSFPYCQSMRASFQSEHACMESGKLSTNRQQWCGFPQSMTTSFQSENAENLALLASHSATKLLCNYHSICTISTISCVINKYTSCYRLIPQVQSKSQNYVVLSIMIRLKLICHVAPLLCTESAIPSMHAGVTYVMGRYDNGGPNTGDRDADRSFARYNGNQ